MTARLIAKQLRACFDRGNKLLICGNGGSAAEAQHFAAELINEYLPCIALTTDTSVITAISNDYDFDQIFSHQVSALGKKGDILIGLSSSGNSHNVLAALETAKLMGLEIIDFPRKGKNTQEIQEKQLVLLHKVWQLVKR